MAITSAQVKAARLLLGWSQSKLAAETGVSSATITKFEAGNQNLPMLDLSVVQRILTDAGIEFTQETATGVKRRGSANQGPAISDETAVPEMPKDAEPYDGSPI
jgi:transcriptional regulator with XRE-family HTH domain